MLYIITFFYDKVWTYKEIQRHSYQKSKFTNTNKNTYGIKHQTARENE